MMLWTFAQSANNSVVLMGNVLLTAWMKSANGSNSKIYLGIARWWNNELPNKG